eukprot:tig00000553_g2075.t1
MPPCLLVSQARPQLRSALGLRPMSVPAKAYDPTDGKQIFSNPKMIWPETKVTVLPNGLRVATERTPSINSTVSVGVWVDAGSRFETEKNNGVAHFLEHMAFKTFLTFSTCFNHHAWRTLRAGHSLLLSSPLSSFSFASHLGRAPDLAPQGTKRRTQYDLETEVENIGGHLNAYTSREQTCYYAKVHKGNTAQAVDILSDILQNSVFSAENVERERDVILREMEEIDAHTQEFIFDQLHAQAFQGSALGRTILGEQSNVEQITRDDCLAFIREHYTAPRMVLAAAGAVDHDELVQLATKHFMSLPTDPAKVAPAPAPFVGSEVRVRNDEMPELSFALAYKTCGWTHSDAVPLMVMQAMVGSWDVAHWAGAHASSGLGKMVTQYGIANRFYGFNTTYSDTGLFGVYAEVNPEGDTPQDMVYAIQHELVRFCFRPEEDEVERAKANLKVQILTQLEHGSTEVAEDIGRQMIAYGRRIPIPEMFARIDAVNVDTIKEVASRYIYDRDHAAASFGPVNNQNLPDYNWVRRRSYWLRY